MLVFFATANRTPSGVQRVSLELVVRLHYTLPGLTTAYHAQPASASDLGHFFFFLASRRFDMAAALRFASALDDAPQA